MSRYCPSSGVSCLDDVCRGGGTCLETGDDLLDRCDFCGGLYNSDYLDCPCGRNGHPEDDGLDDDDA